MPVICTDPDTKTCSYPRPDRMTAASKLSPSEGCPDSVVCHPSHASPGDMNAADQTEKKTSQREAQSAIAFLVSTGKLHFHPLVLIKQCLEIVFLFILKSLLYWRRWVCVELYLRLISDRKNSKYLF